MKRFHPSPALVISLIALFVALGGTSYAAIALKIPKNSVGTAQLKNGAVTAPKLNSAVLKSYLKAGGTLPSGATETGQWGGGGFAGADGGGGTDYAISSFAIPLAYAISGSHAIYVSGSSATHCSGAGHADAGYLCVYGDDVEGAIPTSNNIYNPVTAGTGAAATGFGIVLQASSVGAWTISGTYTVTAP
jgi:hypothetical protein